jgi:hypothetical protein
VPQDAESVGRCGTVSTKRVRGGDEREERGGKRRKTGEKRKEEREVVGSLQKEWERWRELGASEWLVRQVREGLFFRPKNAEELKGKYGRPIELEEEQWEWLKKEFARIEGTGAVEWVGEEGDEMPEGLLYASPVFLVPKTGPKKWRLVIDMRVVNKGLRAPKFKMDRLEEFVRWARKGWFVFTLDLKEGYFHQRLSEEGSKWCGFVVVNRETGRKKWGRYRVLPFGLCLSPQHFTELVKPLLKRWRRRGIVCMAYIDDLAFAAGSREEALRVRGIVEEDLKRFGWVRHESKGQWEPAQVVEYLGLIIDMKEGRWRVPEEKRESLVGLLEGVCRKGKVCVGELAKVLGKLLSLQRAIPLAKLYAREAFNDIMDAGVYVHNCWRKMVRLDERTREDLRRVLRVVREGLGAPLWRPTRLETVRVTADASLGQWGGHLDSEYDLDPAGGTFRQHQKGFGIEMKEGIAILLTLESYVKVLRGKCVSLRTDNKWLEAYLRNEGGNGTKNQRALSRLVREIFMWALRNDALIVEVQWVPSKLNVLADAMSRIEDAGNWTVARWVFDMAEGWWGPHTIDRMATDTNTKCARFNSWRFCPGTEAVNAFTSSWAGENNWVVPPLALVGLVVRHIAESRAKATLLVPNWEAMWSPMLREMTIKRVVVEWEIGKYCMEEDNGGEEIFKNRGWRLMLVRVDGGRVRL